MNFKEDISKYIQGEFGYFGIKYDSSGVLDKDLMNLFTIQKKLIIPIKRVVSISNELQEKIDNKCKHYEEILLLKEFLENGTNVNQHQSTNLWNHHVHDKLVYDWNIYHLHLSFKQTFDDYFMNRTKKVLFAYLEKDKALLIDIDNHPPHDNFANKKLLEILDHNWDDVLKEVNGVLGLSHNPTQQERFRLRKHNLNEGIVEVNGKFIFAPGLGQMASGHSSENITKLHAFNRWVKRNEDVILSNRDIVDKIFIEMYDLKNPPKYKIVFTANGPQIWDDRTKRCLVKYQELIKIKN